MTAPDITVLVVTGPDAEGSVDGETGSQARVAATLASLSHRAGPSCDIHLVGNAAAELRRATCRSRARLISIVHAGDIVFDEALRAVSDVLAADPGAVAARVLALPCDPRRPLTRERARAHVDHLLRRSHRQTKGHQFSRAPGALLERLATFRRDWLSEQDLPTGRDVDHIVRGLLRRATSRGAARLVTRVLCAAPPRGPDRTWRFRAHDLWIRVRSHVGQCASVARVRAWWQRQPTAYEWFAGWLRAWSFDGLRPRGRVETDSPRVAYVLWRYPTLSETFIRREVEAVREAGVSLQVFALEPDDPPAPVDPASPAGEVMYFGPEDLEAGRAFTLGCLRRRPWTVFRLWLLIVRHHHPRSVWWRDRSALYLAGQLASALATHRVSHVHAPWANSYALVSFVAARMLGLTFSVQARASEIHRTSEAASITDRLRFGAFVVTNTRYNERYLRTRLGRGTAPPLHVVHNGVDLSRLRPPHRRPRHGGPFRILSVGRLVEPKGFRYLLEACRLLVDRGLDVRCDIIGGTASWDIATWLDLRMCHASLALGSRVRFRGPGTFSDVLEAMAAADVFVLPCVRARDGSHDITPNALIEAMAVSLPVVSTMSGGIPELVAHDRDGLLVPPGDAPALADALGRIEADADLACRLGASARRSVEERFDVTRNVVRRIELFRSLGWPSPQEPDDPRPHEAQIVTHGGLGGYAGPEVQ